MSQVECQKKKKKSIYLTWNSRSHIVHSNGQLALEGFVINFYSNGILHNRILLKRYVLLLRNKTICAGGTLKFDIHIMIITFYTRQ